MGASLTADMALALLAESRPLEDCSIVGPLWLGAAPLADQYLKVRLPVALRHAAVEYLNTACVVFEAPVCIDHCSIAASCFYAAYFLQGLKICECEFIGPVTFMDGGHNMPGCPVRLAGTVFRDFVAFDDCYFPGPLEIVDCTFHEGSNLLQWVRSPFGLGEEASLQVSGNVGSLEVQPKRSS